MDLVGRMLVTNLTNRFSDRVSAEGVCPAMRRRFGRFAPLQTFAFNADRAVNRFWDYPNHARSLRRNFDLFHIADHSYSHLVHALPPERTVVTCHDLDTFACLLEPGRERRSWLFRSMSSRILTGLKRAARVICVSRATAGELVGRRLISPERVAVIPNGVFPECSPAPDAAADLEADRLLGARDGRPELLHVGSTAPRKRIDVLLELFARVRTQFPDVRLIRVGGPFTKEQLALCDRLHIRHSISVLPCLKPALLAAIYRRAAVLLLTSEREGFGLPLAEAMACGTPVIASDLPVLREVGGRAGVYCAVGDTSLWASAVADLLREDSAVREHRRTVGVAVASRFSWTENVRQTVSIYEDLYTSTFRR